MLRTAPRMRAGALYPAIEPFDWRMLEVGDGHSLYVEQCGRADGVPVVVLHGGPGGGCSPTMRRFFDPAVYRVVLFDQRGCGRSRPHASVQANTTWHLVADIERIREALGIARWIVFGGSWGATLALAYAQSHPERVAYMALRGVFLATAEELDWFYRGGAGRFFPAEWEEFLAPLPEDERHDPIAAYHARLFGADMAEQVRFARAWTLWENRLAAMARGAAPGGGVLPADYARAFARIENHYFANGAFMRADGQLLADAGRMADIPGIIVHGRYDMVCPPRAAWRLHKAWPRAELEFVHDAGHALTEPSITRRLVEAMDSLRDRRRELGL